MTAKILKSFDTDQARAIIEALPPNKNVRYFKHFLLQVLGVDMDCSACAACAGWGWVDLAGEAVPCAACNPKARQEFDEKWAD